ncbi:(deoxy)nucleoside triphosphate pyrophosphohydrolase [Carbonactinospora thermoautotrophica]|uniref:(deoxy)nucleoside triphosphate pyrophosphohydrolase n=1 Tax=Carbonactinospora thermoautotrophica TaxID=1469144 RepID=UPI00099E5DDF|nr:NUDIX domain-containing protein [Carbonactinospora thermoautotrophica]
MGEPVVVVAAAIFADGRLLAAQRAAPEELRGGWELPGGKVEPGEPDELALARECREELGIEIEPYRRLGDDVPIDENAVLRAYAARLVAGTPVPGPDHLALRWLTPASLYDVDWLPADRPVVGHIARVLGELPCEKNQGFIWLEQFWRWERHP